MMTLMSTFLNAAKLDVGVQRLIQGVFLVFLLVVAVSDASKKKQKVDSRQQIDRYKGDNKNESSTDCKTE